MVTELETPLRTPLAGRELALRAARVRLVITDVDGVLPTVASSIPSAARSSSASPCATGWASSVSATKGSRPRS